MSHSILPLYLVIVFGFSIGITHRAAALGVISRQGKRAVAILLGTLFSWALVCSVMGLSGFHTTPALRSAIPFLWQAVVPVMILAVGLLCSPGLRRGLGTIAAATPLTWFVWIQALRIGAVGGIIKGLRGEILSSYVFWVGLPDMIYGISALVLGILLRCRPLGHRTMMGWHLLGPAIILLPTFGGMSFFMREPGFDFIMAFPMVLAPGIVVPLLLFMNWLAAWKLWYAFDKGPRAVGGQSEPSRPSPDASRVEAV